MERGIEEERNGESYVSMCRPGEMIHSFQREYQSRSAAESQSLWASSAMFGATRASHLALCALPADETERTGPPSLLDIQHRHLLLKPRNLNNVR
jgi:hypothetical protein